MINRTIIGKELAEQLLVLTQNTSLDAVDIVFETIVRALVRGEDVRLGGVGTFGVRHYPAREGRNPQTGEKIAIAASVGVSFKPHKALKEALNQAPVRMVGPDRGRTESQRKRA